MNIPNLYTFIGDVADISAKIMAAANKFYSADTTISLHLDETADIDNTIRAAKVRVQSAKSGLDKRQANICVVVKAYDPLGVQLAIAVGKRLSTLFAEDFAAHRLALAVFLSESNEPDVDDISFEMRNKLTYEFLTAIAGHTPFDCVFLLSDRNEHGQVDVANHDNACKFLARLPQVLATSRFVETLAMKAGELGRTLFASGGFWEKEIPYGQPNRQLHHLAKILENELAEGEKIPLPQEQPLSQLLSVFDWSNRTDAKIVADVCSVAAEPLSPVLLAGKTVKESETLLFGDSAARFFETNFPMCEEPEQHPKRLSLRNAVAKERLLSIRLSNISAEITRVSQELAKLEIASHRVGVLDILCGYIKRSENTFSLVDKVKAAVGNCYVFKHKLNMLSILQNSTAAVHAQLLDYIEHIRNIISVIKAQEPSPEIDSVTAQTHEQDVAPQVAKHAVLNISLLRDDGLLHETHILGDETNPYVLRLIGGFAQEDLTRYHAMREISGK